MWPFLFEGTFFFYMEALSDSFHCELKQFTALEYTQHCIMQARQNGKLKEQDDG